MKIWMTAAICLIIASGCKKSDQSQTDCGSYGGLVQGKNYLFWMSQNIGQIKVEVKDQNGNIVTTPYTDVIKVYYASSEPTGCDNGQVDRNTNPVFSLTPGRSYTYRAYNDNYSFTGTINVSCNQDNCNKIKIK